MKKNKNAKKARQARIARKQRIANINKQTRQAKNLKKHIILSYKIDEPRIFKVLKEEFKKEFTSNEFPVTVTSLGATDTSPYPRIQVIFRYLLWKQEEVFTFYITDSPRLLAFVDANAYDVWYQIGKIQDFQDEKKLSKKIREIIISKKKGSNTEFKFLKFLQSVIPNYFEVKYGSNLDGLNIDFFIAKKGCKFGEGFQVKSSSLFIDNEGKKIGEVVKNSFLLIKDKVPKPINADYEYAINDIHTVYLDKKTFILRDGFGDRPAEPTILELISKLESEYSKTN